MPTNFGVLKISEDSGAITSGFTAIGPFKSLDEVGLMEREVGFQYFVFEFEDHTEASETSLNEFPQDVVAGKVLVTGNMFDGLAFMGPFSLDVGLTYAEQYAQGDDWHLVTLHEPPTPTSQLQVAYRPDGSTLSSSEMYLAGTALRLVVSGEDREWLRNELHAWNGDNNNSPFNNMRQFEHALLSRIFGATTNGSSFEVASDDDYESLGAMTEATMILFEPNRDENSGNLIDQKCVWWDESYAVRDMGKTILERGYIDLLCAESDISLATTDEVARCIPRLSNSDQKAWPASLTFFRPAAEGTTDHTAGSVAKSVIGNGSNTYIVPITQNTTASYEITVAANNVEQAIDAAKRHAIETGCADFVPDEGNVVDYDDLCVDDNAVTRAFTSSREDSPSP